MVNKLLIISFTTNKKKSSQFKRLKKKERKELYLLSEDPKTHDGVEFCACKYYDLIAE
jgi:hypothetical protein